REPAGAERRIGADLPEALLAADRVPDLVRADRAAHEPIEEQADERGVHERRVHVVVTAALEALADVLEPEHSLALRLMQAAILDPLLLQLLDLVLERLEVADERIVLRTPGARSALAQRVEVFLP